jgi:hypothetical protein
MVPDFCISLRCIIFPKVIKFSLARSLTYTYIELLETTATKYSMSFTVLLQESVRVRVILRLTVCQSVRPGVEPTLGLTTRCYFPLEVLCLKFSVLSLFGRPLWREVGSVICQSKSVVVCQGKIHIYIFCVIHISNMYIQYTQGLLQSRLGATDYALLFTSSSCYHGSSDTWTVVHMTAAKFKPLIFSACPVVLEKLQGNTLWMGTILGLYLCW